MKFVQIHEVDGEQEATIVEADNYKSAAADPGKFFETTKSGEWEGKDVALVGVYELGQVNHLGAVVEVMELKSQLTKIQEG